MPDQNASFAHFDLDIHSTQKRLSRTKKLNPLPDYKILDSSKLKQIEDDMSKCIKMENKYHIG